MKIRRVEKNEQQKRNKKVKTTVVVVVVVFLGLIIGHNIGVGEWGTMTH